MFARKCRKTSTTHKLFKWKWSVIQFKKSRPYQTDEFDCGIFIIYFMHCLGNKIGMGKDFDPNLFRVNVARMLLEKSLNMRNIFLHCFSEEASYLVMCKYCRRYAHSKCIPGKRKTAEEWADPMAEFICALCACSIRE